MPVLFLLICVFSLLFLTARRRRRRRRCRRLSTCNDQLGHLIRGIQRAALSGDLARRAAVAGRDVERGVLSEEVARPQEEGHGFGGHDGEVFWRGEMRDAEGVPDYDVGVVDGRVAVGDPFGDAARWLAGGLGHVSAGGTGLVVGVWIVGG